MPDEVNPLKSLDALCDEFESAWQSGEQPSLADFLARVQQSQKVAALRELLALELEYVSDADQKVEPSDYRKRFPEFTELVDQVFEAHGRKTTARQDAARKDTEPITNRPMGGGDAIAEERNSQGERYRIVQLHARGGLGEVFVAEDTELKRKVALKEIQTRFAGIEESRSRFLREATITGGLEHPGIVPVYGLGKYGDGRPYYAMRFVKGETLLDAINAFHAEKERATKSDKRELELRKLLRRFVDVCNAIEYAHSRAVIHRDLKPANVMLGKYGETLVVDWGLAKTIDPTERTPSNIGDSVFFVEPTHDSAPTQMGSVMGTPAYMSPEQAAGEVRSLGTSSDIYSLGATLHHLLTGKAPFSVGKDMLEKVKLGQFPRPREVKPNLPTPLESIALKAMSLKPEDRYASAAALADDIESWLADEPVGAHSESVVERSRRWLRRHSKAAAVLAATLVVGLASAIVIAAVVSGKNNALRAANESERAAKDEAEAERAEAVDNLLLALNAVDKYLNRVTIDDRLTAGAHEKLRRDLLLEGRDFYETFVTKEPTEPAIRAAHGTALFRLAMISRELGDLDESVRAFRQAIASLEKGRADEPANQSVHDMLAEAHLHLGVTFRQAGRFGEAAQHYETALAIRRKLVEEYPDDREQEVMLILTLVNAGSFYAGSEVVGSKQRNGQFEAGGRVLLEAVQRAGRLATLPTSEAVDSLLHPELILSGALSNLSIIYGKLGRNEESLNSARRCIEIRERLYEQTPDSATLLARLATARMNLGARMHQMEDWEQALDLNRQARVSYEELVKLRPDVPKNRYSVAATTFNIGQALRALNENKMAVTEYQRAVEILRPLTKRHPESLRYLTQLADVLHAVAGLHRRAGQIEMAVQAYDEAIAVYRKIGDGAPHARQQLAECELRLAEIYRKAGRLDDAEPLYRAAIANFEQILDQRADSEVAAINLSTSLLDLGRIHATQDMDDEAEKEYRAAITILEPRVAGAPDHLGFVDNLINVRENLGLLLYYGKTKDKAQAIALWRSALEVYANGIDRWPHETALHRAMAVLHRRIAEYLVESEQLADAIIDYQAEEKILRRLLERPHVDETALRGLLAVSAANQGSYYQQLKQHDQALTKLQESVATYRTLVANDSANEFYRDRLGRMLYQVAIEHSALENKLESAAAFTKSLHVFEKLAEDFPDNEHYKTAIDSLHKKLVPSTK